MSFTQIVNSNNSRHIKIAMSKLYYSHARSKEEVSPTFIGEDEKVEVSLTCHA